MGIFSFSRQKQPPTPPTGLEERIRKLESNVRQLEDDFTDLWDRTRRAMGRAAKREARAAESAEVERTQADLVNEQIRAQRAARPFQFNQEH